MDKLRFWNVRLFLDLLYDDTNTKVMVFVHARNETVRSAESLVEMAEMKGDLECFMLADAGKRSEIEKTVRVFVFVCPSCIY